MTVHSQTGTVVHDLQLQLPFLWTSSRRLVAQAENCKRHQWLASVISVKLHDSPSTSCVFTCNSSKRAVYVRPFQKKLRLHRVATASCMCWPSRKYTHSSTPERLASGITTLALTSDGPPCLSHDTIDTHHTSLLHRCETLVPPALHGQPTTSVLHVCVYIPLNTSSP